MPPSSSSTSSTLSISPTTPTTFTFPPNDSTTYRDLILFEERLKSTAASLQKRKQRYQLFLFQLLTVIIFLLYEVLVVPEASLLAIPYTWLLQQRVYQKATIHPYLTTGLLFVSVTTLVLFFASGMYSEKIAYANKYVPHTNKALRSFNIYLNMRKPPLRSKFQFRNWNPLSFFFPRPDPSNPSTVSTPNMQTPFRDSSRSSTPNRGSGANSPRSSRSPSPTPSKRSLSKSTSNMVPISPIPPTLNPRGELIFSSRIDKNFRESYERYRAAFERKREAKEREERAARWRHKFWTWVFFWRKPEPEPKHTRTVSLLRGNSKGAPSAMRTPPRTPPPYPQSGRLGVNDRERSVSPSRKGSTSMRATALERSTSYVRSNRGSGASDID
ncbi:Spo7-like protein-domain-containing protein [Lentinula raphanica]|nr:Spo7-like protein-domain-containing protein [Lentinula raphanica]